jgi:anti-sigma factor RsiW
MTKLTDDDREELTAYLDGEAEPDVRARVEANLNRDPVWRAEADALKKAWDMLDHLPRAEPSASFTSQTMTKLSALRPTSSTTITLPIPGPNIPWATIALVVFGLMAGWGVTTGLIKNKKSALDLNDPVLIQDLRLIDNLPIYGAVESLEFLQLLGHPDRFGADSVGP